VCSDCRESPIKYLKVRISRWMDKADRQADDTKAGLAVAAQTRSDYLSWSYQKTVQAYHQGAEVSFDAHFVLS